MAEEPHTEWTSATTWLEVLEFWFSGEFDTLYHHKWFPSDGSQSQAKTDEEVRGRFSGLLRCAEAGGLQDWTATPHSLVALIVLLDQLSRHQHRNTPDRDVQVARCDALALRHAEALQARGGWVPLLTTPQRVFALMPLRHSATVERLRNVLEQVSRLTSHHTDMATLLDKFERATRRRLQHLEGSRYEEGQEVLEFHPFQADESDLHRDKVYRAMEEFLEGQGVTASDVLCVSLSGGVDSMVITKVLAAMRDRERFGRFTILALHVDYNNRLESGAEASFVEGWCVERGVRFRKRVITEAKRGVTARDVYERVARDIRFGFYKDAIQHDGPKAIMFGHHQNDVQENVISNVMKRCQLLDIAGMAPADITNDVLVWRPLLALQKTDVFAFAHKYGVPYLKDTTPAWSTRGTMRNQLMPLLKDMYGAGYLHNLSQLAEHSRQLSELLQGHLLGPFWGSVKEGGLAVWVDCRDYMTMPMIFWREALKHICHNLLGIGLISEDPIKDQLMMRLRLALDPNHDRRNGFVELKKGHRFYLWETTLIFLRAGLFPAQPIVPEGTEATVDAAPLAYGPYKIQLEAVTDLEEGTLDRRLQLLDLLDGTFSYIVPHTGPLVISRDKETRPKMLRQVPKLLTDVMPLVGVRHQRGWTSSTPYVRVTVTADLRKGAAGIN
eukprot:GGOE01001623.1.p1 GENE.GGOE01001623.1~~GGOE01001623.1.p1  ORF type:complete len:690 (-),score=219.47 GGOE01001623.1:340-2346(-)